VQRCALISVLCVDIGAMLDSVAGIRKASMYGGCEQPEVFFIDWHCASSVTD
jgi:hypothetical protein